ncbi:hypothetical protein [Flavobacterium sp. HNIBRBA15423]|uniref:hypothetical protein n=1 Tax=Flavobacterium sp. HNIBRBA15423 TaxID=3458683 RepID=UPI004044395C
MVKDYLEEYRKSIRKQYEIQKNGIHSNFLLNPTEANLRDLCILIFKENQNIDDLNSFRLYLGFDYSIKTSHELNDIKKLNKLKSLGKFLKGKSKLKNINGLDLIAMLVDFEKRPYNKFYRNYTNEDIQSSTEKSDVNVDTEKNTDSSVLTIVDVETPPEKETIKNTKSGIYDFIKKNIRSIIAGSTLFIVISFGVNHFTSEKECMTWVEDHYKEIDCNALNENSNLILIPKDDKLIQNFKKIIPCDTTKYERNGRTCLWYGKSLDGKYEFFTALYFHPETGITLKKVTSTIMKNYGRGPCK